PLAIAQDADHAGAADAGRHFVPELAQLVRHPRGGALLLHRELRVLVQVEVERVELRVHLVEAFERRGGEKRGEEGQHAAKHTLLAPLTRSIARAKAGAVLLLAALLLAAPYRVYVSNEASGDVAVIENDALVARIPVGTRPRGLRIGPGNKLYVAVSGSPRGGPGQRDEDLPPPDRAQDGIAVVDLARRETIGRLPGGPDPESFDLSPDGKLLYVSNEDTAALSVVDIEARKVLRTVKVGAEPEGVTVRP